MTNDRGVQAWRAVGFLVPSSATALDRAFKRNFVTKTRQAILVIWAGREVRLWGEIAPGTASPSRSVVGGTS